MTRSAVPGYVEHFRAAVLPALRTCPGFISAHLLQRPLSSGGEWEGGELHEIVVESRWTSIESIQAFAGESPNLAVVEPAAEALLVEFDTTVKHFVVLDEAT